MAHQNNLSSKMKILIVDDDKKLCGLVADYPEPMGYDVDAAHNGSRGLEMILKGDYEAVILDVMMPQRIWEVARCVVYRFAGMLLPETVI